MMENETTDEETDQYSSTTSSGGTTGGSSSLLVQEEEEEAQHLERPTNLYHRWNSEIHKIKNRLDRQVYSMVKRTQDRVDSVFSCQQRKHDKLDSSDDGFSEDNHETTKRRLLFVQRRKMLRRKQAAAKRYPIQVVAKSNGEGKQEATTILPFDHNTSLSSPRSLRSEKTARSTSEKTTHLSNVTKHVEQQRQIHKQLAVNFDVIEQQDDDRDAFPMSTTRIDTAVGVATTLTVPGIVEPAELRDNSHSIVEAQERDEPALQTSTPIALERLSLDSSHSSINATDIGKLGESEEPGENAVETETKQTILVSEIDTFINAKPSKDLSSEELPSLAIWRQQSGVGVETVDSFPMLLVKRTSDEHSSAHPPTIDDLSSRKAPDPDGYISFIRSSVGSPVDDLEALVTDTTKASNDVVGGTSAQEDVGKYASNHDNGLLEMKTRAENSAEVVAGYKSPLFGLPEHLAGAQCNQQDAPYKPLIKESSEAKSVRGIGKPEDRRSTFGHRGVTAEIHPTEIKECTSELTWLTDDRPVSAILIKKKGMTSGSRETSAFRSFDRFDVTEEEVVSQLKDHTPGNKHNHPTKSDQPKVISELRYAKEMPFVDPKGDSGLYTGVLVSEKPSSFGEMGYTKNGQVYRGTWERGMWHGHGRVDFANGDSYTGQFTNDVRQGWGRYCWADGRSYEGAFANDQREGIGTYYWPNGSIYAGSFRDGLRHGSGTLIFPDGSVYRGEWANGKQHGKGECVWNDGRYYTGEWKQGRVHGQGLEVRRDGTVRHDGEWKNDRPVRPLNNAQVKNRKS